MKKLFVFAALIVTVSVSAQITFDYSPPYGFTKFTTTNAGEKYFSVINGPNGQGASDTLIIYNSDWSVYHTIYMPAGYYLAYVTAWNSNGAGNSMPSLSDNLFNTDAAIEFLVQKVISNENEVFSVMNETGQIEYTFPDTVYLGINLYTQAGNYKVWYYADHDSGFVDTVLQTTTMHVPKIYSLPGSLPCSQCSNSVSGIASPAEGGGAALKAYPSPFSNALTVEYDLQANPGGHLVLTAVDGKELRSMELSAPSGKIDLDTANLPRGIIIVSLIGSNHQLISKKLVKVD